MIAMANQSENINKELGKVSELKSGPGARQLSVCLGMLSEEFEARMQSSRKIGTELKATLRRKDHALIHSFGNSVSFI